MPAVVRIVLRNMQILSRIQIADMLNLLSLDNFGMIEIYENGQQYDVSSFGNAQAAMLSWVLLPINYT